MDVNPWLYRIRYSFKQLYFKSLTPAMLLVVTPSMAKQIKTKQKVGYTKTT